MRAMLFLIAAVGCGSSGGAGVDAAPTDAAAVDSALAACTGDHPERIDRQNDAALGGIESTEFVASSGGAAIAICGELAAGDPDADFYAIEVGGDAELPLRAELRADPGAADVTLTVWAVTGSGRLFPIATAALLGPAAIAATGPLPPGVYAVSAAARDPLDAPIAYEIAVGENTTECPASAGAPDRAEAGDGGDARGNDAIAATFTPVAEFALTSRDDAPEPTGLALAAGQTAHLAGESAPVVSAGDAYRDRDSYELATAADAGELVIRLTWPHGEDARDLDLFLFRAGEPGVELTGGAGSLVGVGQDEVVTLHVDPGAAYWLWVGGYDAGEPPTAAVAYDVTLCAR